MRRQARIKAGGALVVRSASALQVWLWLLIFIFQNEFRISRCIKPGYLDFDNLPETNFTCAGKVIGGYYADLETSCQMFHVCTVGQQDEPMDIKFLCLNGTVFDQETRVCERVDEVDCTKSEKFYSLNLELYGSTAPPIIEPEQDKPQADSTEQTQQHTKPGNGQGIDPTTGISPTTVTDRVPGHSTEVADSTEDPIQEIKKDDQKQQSTAQSNPAAPPLIEHDELTEEYQEDDENAEYEDEYVNSQSTTTTAAPTTTTVPATTTIKQSPTTTLPPATISLRPSSSPHLLSSPSPALSSLSSPAYSSLSPSAAPMPTLDPALLTPQEFIYRHQGTGSEAISFQRHSYRPADGVYITHAPPQQFDHFQYESSRTAPRPVVSRPAPFSQRPQPSPFRPTTSDPRDQLLKPGPTFQPSERHETAVKHNPQTYLKALPAQRPLPFNPFYYDRKRSDDAASEEKSSLSARSVSPPIVTERPTNKPKSPPRVIVTASASVSDSNGKRLNYTVGNVVSAVKPIVPINYDDYKESDLIFDPFFLDVPKLQSRRKTRSNKYRQIFTAPSTITVSSDTTLENSVTTTSPVTSRATTTEKSTRTPSTKPTTTAWNPNDYVDDNYEPHAYVPPIPPLAILISNDRNKQREKERHSINKLFGNKARQDDKSEVGRTEQQYRPTSSATQTSSSHSAGTEATPPPPPPPSPLEAPACASSRSVDCRTRT
ncbi:unnamed protein product [Chilo suppressalis]|uniref:Chitin-binding type-2 domain-containing protein n=1 Tax=Chilo suppressalis TaxID=168631 RepID=A0ABN8BHK4_CHISP|nr:hypothetical protein evm_004116 [Chilo suppressalis]CAH0407798.1 unnamed protein product [Chilo suppressalis]